MADPVAERGRTRPLLTPEGVLLTLTLAEASQRLTAFMLDLVGMALALVTLVAVSLVAGIATGPQLGIVIGVLGFFLLRNFYFAFYELTPRAATPGKRLLNMRVAARDGGPLTANAILARNLVRELELFLPITMLVTSGTSEDVWLLVLGLGWTGIFLVFPLLNRDRLRVGDLLAGTWVVMEPRPLLVPDLAVPTARPRAGTFQFTKAQRTAYGVKELHVLEDVLRRQDAKAMVIVADSIRARIGWKGGWESNAAFLEAYYAALREELEGGLLFGKRKADKYSV